MASADLQLETEVLVCQAFASVLRLRDVAPDDNFDDLGGTSIQALQLPLQLETVLQRPIVVNPLQTARTPRDMARQLLMQQQLAEADIYYLPGIDGGLSSLEMILPAFESNDLIRALTYPADLSLRTIPEIAAHLLENLPPRRKPYKLLGYSFGGRVAFELARQLIEAGEQVDFIGIIDASAQGSMIQRKVPIGAKIRLALRLAARTTPFQWLASIRYRLLRKVLVETPFVLRNREACDRYAPQPIDADVTLIRCDSMDDSLGWAPFCSKLRIQSFAGTHNLYDPIVTPALLEALRFSLRRESVTARSSAQ